jgi:hypothetical protein
MHAIAESHASLLATGSNQLYHHIPAAAHAALAMTSATRHPCKLPADEECQQLHVQQHQAVGELYHACSAGTHHVHPHPSPPQPAMAVTAPHELDACPAQDTRYNKCLCCCITDILVNIGASSSCTLAPLRTHTTGPTRPVEPVLCCATVCGSTLCWCQRAQRLLTLQHWHRRLS